MKDLLNNNLCVVHVSLAENSFSLLLVSSSSSPLYSQLAPLLFELRLALLLFAKR